MTRNENRNLSLAEEVRAELCGEGGQWETTVEDVLGQQSLVFRNRHRNIEEMFAAFTDKWSGRECLV